jgi:hypothetical protein
MKNDFKIDVLLQIPFLLGKKKGKKKEKKVFLLQKNVKNSYNMK